MPLRKRTRNTVPPPQRRIIRRHTMPIHRLILHISTHHRLITIRTMRIIRITATHRRNHHRQEPKYLRVERHHGRHRVITRRRIHTLHTHRRRTTILHHHRMGRRRQQEPTTHRRLHQPNANPAVVVGARRPSRPIRMRPTTSSTNSRQGRNRRQGRRRERLLLIRQRTSRRLLRRELKCRALSEQASPLYFALLKSRISHATYFHLSTRTRHSP